MAIDVQREKLIELEHAGDEVKPRRDRSSMWRYFLRGVKAGSRRVKLETVKVGGRRYTSSEAWQRFIEATTGPQTDCPGPTRRARQREQKDAADRLAAAGLISPRRKKSGRADGGHQRRPGPPVPAEEPADAI